MANLFSSRRKQYMQIGDDYDARDSRQPVGLSPFGENRAAMGHHPESAPLISSNGNHADRMLNSQPTALSAHLPNFEEEAANRPEVDSLGLLTMASSSDDRSNWDHIHDLDEFFRRLYEYHQGGGYVTLLWKSLWQLFQFLFIVCIATFLTQCLDYDVLFNNKTKPDIFNSTEPFYHKRYFADAIIEDWHARLHPAVILCLLFATLYWIFLTIRTSIQLVRLKEIQNFFVNALDIPDEELNNTTWEAVVQSICKAQTRHHFMVQDESITSIDIYHRILRFKNYTVALIGQDLLPPLVFVPVVGEIRYFPDLLKTNLEWLLFRGFLSMFKGSHTIQDEYKPGRNLEEQAEKMEGTMLKVGLANLVLMPLLLVYKILHVLFTAADLTKRDSGALGNRAYSNYGRMHVRHFNELEHELRGRLSRSHAYANAYVAQFNQPTVVLFARNISFVASAVFLILTALSVWDEDVLTIDHVLTVITLSGSIVLVCRSMIPDENMIWQPEFLLTNVTSELQYVKDHWVGRAHDQKTVREFETLFRLKAVNLLEELTSPILTPFILLFYIRPLSRAIIQFIQENTDNSDEGLGDICTFARLDVATHGDPTYQKVQGDVVGGDDAVKAPIRDAAHNGRTELSAIQFAIRNPDWKPPDATASFLHNFKKRMERDAFAIGGGAGRNTLADSIHALTSVPMQPSSLFSIGHSTIPGAGVGMGMAPLMETSIRNGGILEGSLRRSGHDSVVEALRERPGAEMRVSTLFLRGLRGEQRKKVACYESIGPGEESQFAMPTMDMGASRRPPSERNPLRRDRDHRLEEEEEAPPVHSYT